jgi:hypothetical protein
MMQQNNSCIDGRLLYVGTAALACPPSAARRGLKARERKDLLTKILITQGYRVALAIWRRARNICTPQRWSNLETQNFYRLASTFHRLSSWHDTV